MSMQSKMPEEDGEEGEGPTFEELLADLGVTIEATPRKRPTTQSEAPKRFTDWSNVHSFEFVGYVALVTQHTCEHCGSMRETFHGVFSEERKTSNGSRRLQALGRGMQWPTGGEQHKCEVTQAFTQWCPDCIRGLGFDREVEALEVRQLKVEE